MKPSTRQLLKDFGEKAKYVFRPQSRRDWILSIIALWAGVSGLTMVLLGVLPQKTWVTFIAFVLPACIYFVSAMYMYAVRLLSPRSQRIASWKLTGKIDGNLWFARIFLMVPLVISFLSCMLLLWEFFHLEHPPR